MADTPALRPPTPGLIARAAQAVSYAITGITPETWMGPNQPLQPMAQQSKGRAWDYPVAFNLNYQPRASEPLSFVKLKTFAEYGIVREVIQTRKDQLASLEWAIRPKEIDGKQPKASDHQGKIKEITNFLQYPDRRLDWAQWLAEGLEQHFVYDAWCVNKQRTRGGKLYALNVIDGATMSIKLDADGRPHPPPPSVAYQQVLKGIPASNYTAVSSEGPQFTTADMLYFAKNARVDRAYGFPPVAQIITYVEMSLLRVREQLAEYTSGNSPQGVMEGPPSMTTDQIVTTQAYWDSLFAGNIEQRRRLWWVPNGTKYVPVDRDKVMADLFDEWLARVICYAFSIAPAPFIKQASGRSQAADQETAAAEGLQPLMKTTARVVNRLLSDFDAPDLEFAWIEDDEFDPSKKAVVDNLYVRSGIKSIDDIRESLGLDPIGGACDTPMFATATGYVPVDPVEAGELTAANAAKMPQPALPPGMGGASGKPGAGGKPPGANTGQLGAGAKGNAKPALGGKQPGARGLPAKATPIPNKTATPAVKKTLVKSLYIARPLINAHEVIAWAKSQGFTDVPNDLHVTQAYSRDPVDWGAVQVSSAILFVEGGHRKVASFDDMAIVLVLNSDELRSRFGELQSYGASYDYADFVPHVTVSYGKITGSVETVSKDADGHDVIEMRARTIADVEPYQGALIFGDEVWKAVDDDWQALIEKVTSEDVAAAAAEANPNPSDAAIASGNYKHGHITIQGLDITIENAQGSTRSGTGPDGEPWSVTMPAHYGYIKRTTGMDGEHVDVYIGPNPESPFVWIIDQVDADTAAYDEHKVMIGYDRSADAQQDYLKAFSDGKGHLRVGAVSMMTMDEFKEWLDSGNTTEPVAMNKAGPEDEPRDDHGKWTGDGSGTKTTEKPHYAGATHTITGKAGARTVKAQAFDVHQDGKHIGSVNTAVITNMTHGHGANRGGTGSPKQTVRWVAKPNQGAAGSEYRESSRPLGSKDEAVSWLVNRFGKSVDVGTGLVAHDQGVPAKRKPKKIYTEAEAIELMRLGKRVTMESGTTSTGLVFYTIEHDDEYDIGETAQEMTEPEDWDPARAVGLQSRAPPKNEAMPELPPKLAEVGKVAAAPFFGHGETTEKFDPDEPRDERGRWTTGGSGPGEGTTASSLYDAHNVPISANELYAKMSPEVQAKIQEAKDKLAASTPTDALPSQGGFKNADGTYTAERQALHDKIEAAIFTDAAIRAATPAPGENPVYTTLGGRGGSGKSALTAAGGPADTTHALVLDSDAIKGMLPEYQGWNAALLHGEAGDIFNEMDATARTLGLNVIHDTTLRTDASFKYYAAAYKAAGYDLKGYYMFAPPQVAAERAIQRFVSPPPAGSRAGSTGRFVPPEIVLASTDNEKTFDSIKSGMKDWAIYSAMTNPATLVARKS